MGFVLDEAVYTVDFSATKLAGLEIRLREISTEEALALSKMSGRTDVSGGDDSGLRDLLAAFVDIVIGWNLERNGSPEPVSVETLLRYPPGRFVKPVIEKCLAAIGNVDDDLGKDSPSGGPSPVESLPMAPL